MPRVRKSENPNPWMTPRLKQCIRKKSKLYKLYLKGKITRGDYTFYRNTLTNVIRRSKKLYYSNILIVASKDSKQLWKCLNSLINRSSCPSLKQLVVDNVTLVGQDLANYVNNYFVSAVRCITRHLPPPPEYIFMTAPICSSCFFYPASPSEVVLVIKALKNKGNKLLDIHPSIIKCNIVFFGSHLSNLYNFSLIECIYPGILKIGRVSPAYKSGPTDVIDNYRPISALPVFSKVFEKLTFTRMNNFISRHNVLSPCQFGFRAGRSTTHAVIKLLSHVVAAFHEKIYSACFFLDLRKAFDTVDHKILLNKLQHYGFRGQSHDYLKSYFENRQQYVNLNGFRSDVLRVTNGVPQGSILGPLCFSLYINDIPLAVDAHSVLFADDAAFIITAVSLKDLYDKIKKLFADLLRYLNMNRLVPNSSKSKLMMFSSRPTENLPQLTFANEIVEWVEEYKYLGLNISNKLCFSAHINRIALNVSRITGTFTNLRTIVPFQTLVTLYYSLVYPHLTYHVTVWGSAPACHLKNLSTRLNNLLRVMCGVRWTNNRPNISTRVMYGNMKILTLESVFKYNLFVFLRQLLEGHLPDFYDVLLEPYTSLHTYGTRGRGFRHPALVCEVERRFLPHQLILLFDTLPEDIFNVSITTSLKHFKSFLLNSQ